MKLINFIAALSLLVFLSCGSKSKSSRCEEVFVDSLNVGDTLIKVLYYKDSSKRDGIYELYNTETGQLVKISQFMNEHLSGLTTIYHKNSGVYITEQWKNGRRDGVAIAYRDNGIIEQFAHFDNSDTAKFILSYDEFGKPLSYSGGPIINTKYELQEDNGVGFYTAYFVSAPGVIYHCSYSCKDSNGNILSSDTFANQPRNIRISLPKKRDFDAVEINHYLYVKSKKGYIRKTYFMDNEW